MFYWEFYMKKLSLLMVLLMLFLMASCSEDNNNNESEAVSLSGYTILQMDFINANEGWILASVNGQNKEYKLLHSSDGFLNYSVISDAPPRFRKLKFIDKNIGYGISWDGSNTLFYTKDGGKNWINFSLPTDSYMDGYDITYNDNYFVVPLKRENPNTFLMQTSIRYYNRDFTYSHEILFDNPGVELVGGSSGTDQHYSSVHLSNDNKVSFTGVYKQKDAMEYVEKSYAAYSDDATTLNLIEVITDSKKSPERTQFTSDKVGYFTLDGDGGLYKTIDSGETWNKVYTFENKTMYKVISFANDKDGAILGDALYLTKDGGESFHKYEVDKSSSIEDVVYVDSKNIYIVLMEFQDGIMEQKLMKISD